METIKPHMSLSELWEMVMDREAWPAVIHGGAGGVQTAKASRAENTSGILE